MIFSKILKIEYRSTKQTLSKHYRETKETLRKSHLKNCILLKRATTWEIFLGVMAKFSKYETKIFHMPKMSENSD